MALGVLGTVDIAQSHAQEEVDNPVFRNWKDFPVGSTVSYRSTTKAGENANIQEFTLRLKAKTADRITIERQLTAIMPDGTRQEYPAMTSENARIYRLPKGAERPDPNKPKGVTATGEEELEMLGRKIKAKWFKAKMRVEAGDMFTHSWSSDQVPGGLVKAVNETPATKSVNTVELIELKIPGEAQESDQ
jgi:hypothetical protein